MAWLIIWQMGGPELENRKVLAITSSMRDVAICFLITTNILVSKDTESPLFAFNALLTPINLVFAEAMKRIQPKSEKEVNQADSDWFCSGVADAAMPRSHNLSAGVANMPNSVYPQFSDQTPDL
jgi:hypothetical protein